VNLGGRALKKFEAMLQLQYQPAKQVYMSKSRNTAILDLHLEFTVYEWPWPMDHDDLSYQWKQSGHLTLRSENAAMNVLCIESTRDFEWLAQVCSHIIIIMRQSGVEC